MSIFPVSRDPRPPDPPGPLARRPFILGLGLFAIAIALVALSIFAPPSSRSPAGPPLEQGYPPCSPSGGVLLC